MEGNVLMIKKKQILIVSLCLLASFAVTGCGGENAYEAHVEENTVVEEEITGMADDLAVISSEAGESYESELSDVSSLVINDTTNEIISASNCFEQRYPASITKVMTAILTLENLDLSETITLDHDVVMTEEGAVSSTLSAGDTVTIEQVFKTMLVKSANDCAVILAEQISGSEEKFAELMTQRAKELGATHTQFKNSNGLHLDGHYTTAYDLYLIFKEAVTHEEFVNTVSLSEYTLTYTDSAGETHSEYMDSTNHFLTGESSIPNGVIMYGGKTGTTSMAGSCLMVMTENESGERFFSVILGEETKEQLYTDMTDLLEKTVN